MAQCKQCKKKGFFLVINKECICLSCEKKNAEEAKTREKEKEAKRWEPRPYNLREGDWYLAYSYKKVPLIMLFPDMIPGNVDLRTEESGEVSVLYKEVQVGIVSDLSKAKMIADFLSRGELVMAQMDSPETLYIGFYKQLLKQVEKCESMLCKIIKTTKKDELFDCPRYENLDGMCDGDIIKLKYDNETETYVLLDFAEAELGEFSKSDSRKLSTKENEGFTLFAVATNCDIDENFRPTAKAIVYFK